MKNQEEKIVVLTAYDHPTARIVDEVGIDAILVGDSLSNVVLGYENTLSVKMKEMLHHTKSVARANPNSLLIGDMPFGSYQVGAKEAVKNATKFIQEGGAEAVKIEGGKESVSKVEKIIDAGIPVMGHLGLTPQKILQLGGYQPRGKTAKEAQKILKEAQMLEEAGAFSVVLESIPQELGKIITEKLEIPTIGIGAGPHCDGQVLVFHDLVGLTEFSPKFAKKYVNLDSFIEKAVKEFRKEVKSKEFPNQEHSYNMEKEELNKLKSNLEENS